MDTSNIIIVVAEGCNIKIHTEKGVLVFTKDEAFGLLKGISMVLTDIASDAAEKAEASLKAKNIM